MMGNAWTCPAKRWSYMDLHFSQLLDFSTFNPGWIADRTHGGRLLEAAASGCASKQVSRNNLVMFVLLKTVDHEMLVREIHKNKNPHSFVEGAVCSFFN